LAQFIALFSYLLLAPFTLQAQEKDRIARAAGAANPAATLAAGAATFDATRLRAPTNLGPTWAVIGGDDPAYARADFDDRKWALLDLKQSLKSLFPKTQPEVLWYRLHVKVDPNETELAITEHNVSTAFEIFINGQSVLKTGNISPFKPYTKSARILVKIPKAQCASGWLVIALRVYLSRSEWSEPNPGLTSSSLAIGEENELEEHSWLRAIGSNATYWVNLLLVFGLGMVALALFIAQPRNREYLWIFLQFVAQAAALPWSFILLFHEMPASWGLVLLPINMLNFLFLALMYLAFLRQRFTLWMRIYFGFTGALVAGSVIGVSTGIMPAVFLGIILVPFLLFLNLVVPILLIVHLRRGNREAGILLIPALLTGATSYIGLAIFFVSEIPSLEGPSSRFYDLLFASKAGPFTLNLEDFANLLFNLSLLLILVLRSTRMSRQQAVFQGELEAARELQQVIVPEHPDAIPGFAVESVYEPAQQVGGDFFQVLPTQDGGLLVVVGDVAGKGLPAAMLVSVMVGAIRATAEYTQSADVLLASLNERLIGRSRGGFSTALAAHVFADGQVAIANAGHLSPYLDGVEMALPGALPLGIMSGAHYEVTWLELAPGSRLTFYSDGVIEAQNPKGELFGFERGQEISTQSAASIVEAAKLFGQSDDITVVAITRAAAIASAA
jgi:hypothetical protein